MAVSHLSFNDQLTHGRILRSSINKLEEGLEELQDVLATMALMLDGDGSQAAHFAYATTKFGFSSDANAKAAYDELNSLSAKLTTDASVSNVNAAMLQAFNKFR